jgi:hypothetical protein
MMFDFLFLVDFGEFETIVHKILMIWLKHEHHFNILNFHPEFSSFLGRYLELNT